LPEGLDLGVALGATPQADAADDPLDLLGGDIEK
jgi:hypothetical protein